MSISIKDLFSRQNMAGTIISLRNSLANHPKEFRTSLREAHKRLLEPADGDGFSRGCRPSASVKISFGVGDMEMGETLPQWAPVAGNTAFVRDHRTGETKVGFREDFAGETRTVQGVLAQSRITSEDFPFKPWHTYYDWNFYVRFDKQYKYLSSPANHDGEIECEWDTAFLPSWAWPQDGDRVWIVGRWIYDCGHPKDNLHKTEIHPPKALASFRSQATDFAGNPGPTRANHAILYIARDGGYWRQPINDQDYTFDLYLPPKPYAEAAPRFKIVPQTGSLPVQPQITPFPAHEPRAFRVVIPLRGVEPHPENYGAIISAGWSDPQGTETAAVKLFRITVEEILMDANLDPDPFDKDEWYVYIGVNGRWRVWKGLSGESKRLNHSVVLPLHPSDRIHITACGFEADEINGLMGRETGSTWADVSDPSQSRKNAEKIRDGFLSLGKSLAGTGKFWESSNINNEAIGTFSHFHPPEALDLVTVPSPEGKYRLRYKVEVV
jgi:hypothetical protein